MSDGKSCVSSHGLDKVSTTCGSGWVADRHVMLQIDFGPGRLTHPLPQVVLTFALQYLHFIVNLNSERCLLVGIECVID